jgi:hypothetical protein
MAGMALAFGVSGFIPHYRMVIVMMVPSGNAAPMHREIERAAIDALNGTG